MSFGEQLQEVRRSNGMTQEQFAEALQVSRQAVSRWESGRSYPEVDKILYICNRYGVSIGTLFAEENPTPDSGRPQPPQTAAQPPKDSLFTSLDSFITNLSPKSKWIGMGILVGVALLALLIGLCLKGGSGDMSTIIWIAAIVIFGVVEAATVGLVSIWFVIGSAAGLIAAVLDSPIWLQVVVFFIVSIGGADRHAAAGEEAGQQGRHRYQRRPGAGRHRPRYRDHRQHHPLRRGVHRRQNMDGPQRIRRGHRPGDAGKGHPSGGREAVCGRSP